MDKNMLINYIADSYGVSPEHPWESHPDYMVFRHDVNRKWFAVIMNIPKNKLGLGEGEIDIVNLKCEPLLTGALRQESGIFPAYHMNKNNWVSVCLDGSCDDDKIIRLLNMSFGLTAPKIKKKTR
ncbi:MAG: MmcQ/YjbR family DNA-binding protein [Ruminococcaceae bacterium]|nr:MmcQ/YjbR family DNA-binding protein [Oscillospiraceae bacterium]